MYTRHPHPSIQRPHFIHADITRHAVVLLLNDAQSARTSPRATRTETLAIASLERTATVAVRHELSKQLLCILSWKCHVHSPKSSPKVSFLPTSRTGSGTCVMSICPTWCVYGLVAFSRPPGLQNRPCFAHAATALHNILRIPVCCTLGLGNRVYGKYERGILLEKHYYCCEHARQYDGGRFFCKKIDVFCAWCRI